MRRRSGLGSGWRAGSAESITASTHDPSRMIPANIRSCRTVRSRSPAMRASGRPVSSEAAFTSVSPSAAIPSAARSSIRARADRSILAISTNASDAASHAVSTLEGDAETNGPAWTAAPGVHAGENTSPPGATGTPRTIERPTTTPGGVWGWERIGESPWARRCGAC